MKSQASLPTQEAQRIAKRLYQHWKHKFEVSEQAHIFQIHMPDALVTLTALETQLEISIDTQRDDYTFLENVVIDHLSRMAKQDCQATWTRTV